MVHVSQDDSNVNGKQRDSERDEQLEETNIHSIGARRRFHIVLKSTLLLKMHELCKTPIPTFDKSLTPTLSPPPPPVAAAYMPVIYDENCPLPPFLPSFLTSKDDETGHVVNKQVFRPIPVRIRPILRSEIMNNNYPSHVPNKQVLFRPITIGPNLRPRIQDYNLRM